MAGNFRREKKAVCFDTSPLGRRIHLRLNTPAKLRCGVRPRG